MEKELRPRSVTRLLLWEEYRAANPDGFGYTWFCTTFEAWKQRTRPSMRQTHIGGEKVFVDFAGDTIDIFDPITGEVRAMKLFVAAMGASNYTYTEACPSESLFDWIGLHANLFQKGEILSPSTCYLLHLRQQMRWMAPAHGIWVPKCEGPKAFTSKIGAILYADYHDRPRLGQERFSGPRH